MKIQLRNAILLFFTTFSISAYAQQNATIKGKITTADGKPAQFVNIGLKNKNQSTTTNDNGEYTIQRVKPGTYTIKVSAVGLNIQEKNINTIAGQTLVLNFVLTENSQA
ncbi:MAG: carboxypeptidase-like regulatory domain-containing protein, partial [Pedobacter sp.]